MEIGQIPTIDWEISLREKRNLFHWTGENIQKSFRKIGDGLENPPTLLVGMWIVAATMENTVELPEKTKNRGTISSSSPIP